jgi:hypothetical protein
MKLIHVGPVTILLLRLGLVDRRGPSGPSSGPDCSRSLLCSSSTSPVSLTLERRRRQRRAGPLGGDCVEVVEMQLRLLEGAGAGGG